LRIHANTVAAEKWKYTDITMFHDDVPCQQQSKTTTGNIPIIVGAVTARNINQRPAVLISLPSNIVPQDAYKHDCQGISRNR
jgi:hypothetical protein